MGGRRIGTIAMVGAGAWESLEGRAAVWAEKEGIEDVVGAEINGARFVDVEESAIEAKPEVEEVAEATALKLRSGELGEFKTALRAASEAGLAKEGEEEEEEEEDIEATRDTGG